MKKTKLQLFEENIFLSIAKMLALSQVKRELPKAMNLVKDDKELLQAMSNLAYLTQDLEMKLLSLCKRHPDAYLCKKYHHSGK